MSFGDFLFIIFLFLFVFLPFALIPQTPPNPADYQAGSTGKIELWTLRVERGAVYQLRLTHLEKNASYTLIAYQFSHSNVTITIIAHNTIAQPIFKVDFDNGLVQLFLYPYNSTKLLDSKNITVFTPHF